MDPVPLPPDDYTPLERQLGHLESTLGGFASDQFGLDTPEQLLAKAQKQASKFLEGGLGSRVDSTMLDAALGAWAADIRATPNGRVLSDIVKEIAALASELDIDPTRDPRAELQQALNGAAAALNTGRYADAATEMIHAASAAAVVATRA